MRNILLFLLLSLSLFACTPESPPVQAPITAVTGVPTLDRTDPEKLCQTATEDTGANWLRVIDALETLQSMQVICDDNVSIESRLYQAYLAYGTQMEAEGRESDAISAYDMALTFDRTGDEASARLQRLQVATPAPLQRCDASVVTEAIQALPDYMPTTGSFARLNQTGFEIDDEPFYVYGVNYYPRETPFAYFLTRTETEVVSAELDIIQKAGINTLRIFLRPDDLFICPGNGAVPVAETFQRLDQIIQIAAEKSFKLILVLNQNADLQHYPLYENPDHVIDRTTFIVERYRDEPAVLAWDIRDRGDIDYRSDRFSREIVLEWVSDTVRLIRRLDTNHPVTAGWWQDASATAPLVDFVSFQHYGEYEPLRQRIALLRDSVNRPILLTAIGYSTFSVDETAQRNLLYQAFEEVRHNDMAGWMIYLAFDFPRTATCIEPDCPGDGKDIDHYGIWNTSYFPKLAVDAVERITGVSGD